MTRARIGLIGDYSPEVRAHKAIPLALQLAADKTGCGVETTWIATEALERGTEQLLTFDALWCVPGSPYASMHGALGGIRFARESGRPFLGTCGGFQHALIEYARNVLGFVEADHAESNRAAAMPLVAPLSCSLVGAANRIMLKEGSRISFIYGATETTERYHCNYGFNPHYQSLLEGTGLGVTGVDAQGDVRIVELVGCSSSGALLHPFFIATLFQPELSAFEGKTHPLVCAYLQAARRHQVE